MAPLKMLAIFNNTNCSRLSPQDAIKALASFSQVRLCAKSCVPSISPSCSSLTPEATFYSTLVKTRE